MGVGLSIVSSVVLLSSCVFDGSEAQEDGVDTSDPAPAASVVIPSERLSPFCQAMIDLTDRVRSGDDVGEVEIVETYRSISGDVPAEIADDFALVLQALESGAPAPTDPPRATIPTLPDPETSPPTGASATTLVGAEEGSVPSSPSVPASAVVDERFDRDDSPAERINTYVSFVCRDSDNNPGPPATQPLDAPTATDGD